MNHLRLLLFFLFVGSRTLAQTDFNNYQTLQSAGDLPATFLQKTYNKVKADKKTIKSKDIGSLEDKITFLEQTRYAIDDILHSGQVVYGDKITLYINSVADLLLEDNQPLRNELQFLTLKSNAANAFSTDQGIIFVTTGLISRLSSEAQLAFVLAHEISHYTEKHVAESFVFNNDRKNHREDFVRKASVYSKNHEIDADKLAVSMYQNAGYSKDELLSVLDVLLYAYLPFENIEVEQSYFESEHYRFEHSKLPAKQYEINANSNQDDEFSSHPNIATRKEEITAEIEKINGTWGENRFSVDEALFEEIIDISRFESVRIDILNSRYADALYSIYVLEQKHTESTFLSRMKAQAWLSIYQFKSAGILSETLMPANEREGASGSVHYFLSNLTKNQVTTLSIRTIYDLNTANSDDSELNAIYHFLINELTRNHLDLEPYQTISYDEAYAAKDSITLGKNYTYALYDIVQDAEFIQLHKKALNEEKEQQMAQESLDVLTDKDLELAIKENQLNRLHLGINDLIVIDPFFLEYSNGDINRVISERRRDKMIKAIDKSAKLSEMNVHSINSSTIQNSTEIFNQRNALISSMIQVAQNENFKSFPVDFSLVQDMKQKYGTSKVMLTIAGHTFDPKISAAALVLSAFCYVTVPFVYPTYIPIAVMLGHRTNVDMFIFDFETGEILAVENFSYNESFSKHQIGARMYDLFVNLKTATN